MYGPFVFGEPTVAGCAYIHALQMWLFRQMKESEPDNFIWQQDRAPLQWHLSVRDWLNITVLDQWILRKGPRDKVGFTWPPSSPDLTTCDFYPFWFIKNCVYVLTLPADLPDLRHMIEAAVVRINSDTLNKVWDKLAY
ncbi:uncharacterized protein TNCV_2716161 [Trichonephila clavipes]|nr:uncharacterized protein TNCV_2716161 [Trichonephila clavipes]